MPESSDLAPYRGGRPSKLTDSLIVQFATLIAGGYSIARTCAKLDVGQATYTEWMQRAQTNEEPYATLAASVQRAKADRTQALYEKVVCAADQDWKAAAWLLERTAPDEFAKRSTDAPQHAQQHQHVHVHLLAQAHAAGIISDEQLRQIDAQIISSSTDAPAPQNDAQSRNADQ